MTRLLPGDGVEALAVPALGWDFAVPPEQVPTAPPERRGIPRDQVRLLVVRGDGTLHDARFRELGRFLGPADTLVVNTSATRPAAVDAVLGRRQVVVHLAQPSGDGTWVVEVRRADGEGPVLGARPGQALSCAEGAEVVLSRPAAVGPDGDGVRLWHAHLVVPGGRVGEWLADAGRPITYGARAQRWPLEDHQTVFARHQASAEMPSAARPFSLQLVAELVASGVTFAPLQLHAGVSSQQAGEPPMPERYVVGERTAALVNATRDAGGRVIAVGTTVVRALETVAGEDGRVRPGRGWTDLVVTPSRGVRVVDGLVTGWHEADASHLHLLGAIGRPEVLRAAYHHALTAGYAWHEFGDSALLLP